MPPKKKLIEIALPLDAINKASAREKSIRHGHPSTLHLWWSRKPLATARAVIFSQMVDDPSEQPELFPTTEAQEKERQRLFRIIEDLVLWENTTNETVLQAARDEILKSWQRTCAENADQPNAKELFNPEKLPAFHDPFAGGGSIPLEAQRLGLESYASDLNPVAVLINKAMIEIPPKFSGQPPINPEARQKKSLATDDWKGAQGLAEDVRYYGQWMRDEAEKRIGHLYPKIEITAEMVEERPDLKQYEGKKLTVIAWLWARTVKSPNPAFSQINVPLASTFMLSTKPGKEAYIEPIIETGGYRFTVKIGKPKDEEKAKNGTKLSRGANFYCLMSGMPITGHYIKAEGKAGRMGACIRAIVAIGDHGRVYLAPTNEHEVIAHKSIPVCQKNIELLQQFIDFSVGNIDIYGINKWRDLFTDRQLVALTTFSDLIPEVQKKIKKDYKAFLSLNTNEINASAYSEAVSIYLAFAVDKCADYWNKSTTWMPRGTIGHLFVRQAVPMIWDYPEANPFIDEFHCAWHEAFNWVAKSIGMFPISGQGFANLVCQKNAVKQSISSDKIVSTDPPYADTISYANLSDFFYIWLRRSLKSFLPNLFSVISTPKIEELIVAPHRHHNNRKKAEQYYQDGIMHTFQNIAQQMHPVFPITIYYAYKQSETNEMNGTINTYWDIFLTGLIDAGFSIGGTWPMRTERSARSNAQDVNALASSIVLVCRKRPDNSPIVTRREFINLLKSELPIAFNHLKSGNIAPVDLAQAIIGPGMAIFTRFSKIVDSQGNTLTVREALALINKMLDETLAEQEGNFDADSRWALAWFEQFGFKEGEYGDAEILSKAKNTSLDKMRGIVNLNSGKVRLLSPQELSIEWELSHKTVWENVHYLIRALMLGEESAAVLMAKMGENAENARDLSYRLYVLCERKNWTNEALNYNGLVQSWPEISRLAHRQKEEQKEFF